MVCFSDVPYESKGLISAYWSSCMVFYLDILFQILTRKSFLNFNLKTGSLLLVVSFSSFSYLSLTFCLLWFIFFGWDLLVFVWFMVISASFLPTLLAVSCHLCARAAHVTDFVGASPSFCYLDDGCWWLHIAFQASSCQYLKMGVSWWSFGFVGIGLFVCFTGWVMLEGTWSKRSDHKQGCPRSHCTGLCAWVFSLRTGGSWSTLS